MKKSVIQPGAVLQYQLPSSKVRMKMHLKPVRKARARRGCLMKRRRTKTARERRSAILVAVFFRRISI